jgi:hypothetical protein
VHSGFHKQFKSLTTEAKSDATNITHQLYLLSNGTKPSA